MISFLLLFSVSFILRILLLTLTLLTFACSKSTIETLEKGAKYVISFEHITHLFLLFLLLTWNK